MQKMVRGLLGVRTLKQMATLAWLQSHCTAGS